MTITVAPARSEYTANADQTIFNYTFKIFEDTDLNVYITPSGQDANDLTDLTVAYTVTGLGDEDGGTITLSTGTNLNDLVTIVSGVPSSRAIDYQNNGDFRPDVVNSDFDRVVSIVKKIEDNSNRSVLLEQSQQGSKPLSLPKPEAGKALVWNDDNTGLINIPITTDTSLLALSKVTLTVIPGETVYTLPTPISSESVVIIDGEILRANSYGTNINGDLVLSKPLYNSELMFEVWNRAVSTDSETGELSALSFDLPSRATTLNIANANVFFTNDGVALGDNFGAAFSYTGFSNTVNAGTIDVNSANIYDAKGREFKHTGKKITLESLGVPYTETTSVVLGYIVALRENGFSVDLSPRYSLTDFDGRKNIQYSEKVMILHRGLEDYAPQNTLLAFSIAINSTLGQNIALEFDVQVTSDGVPVVFHDLSVDALTDGTGEIKAMTLAQVKLLKFTELVGTVFEDDVHIPTLDETMQYVSTKGVEIYPEAKEYRTIADIKLMTDIVANYRHGNLTRWSSFRIEDMTEFRNQAPQSPIGLVKEGVITQSEIDVLSGLGGDIEIIAGISYLLATPVDVAIYRSYGWGISGWTATRYETIQDLAAIGVHKVITDRNLTPTPRLASITSPILFNKNPWAEVLTGGGSIVYSDNPQNAQPIGEVAVCEAGAGDSGELRLPFNVTSGEVIELTVFARNIGGHPDNGSLNVNRPAVNRKNSLNVITDEMMEYKVNYQAPWLETFACYEGAFDLGSISSRDSGIKIYRPVVSSTHSGYGANRVIMQGCIVLASGGVAGVHILDTDTTSNNVDSITANGNKIDIRPQRETQLLSAGIYGQYPFNNVSMADTGQNTLFLSIDADSRFSTGNLRITCRDSSGVEVDLSALTVEHRFYFKVEM